MAPIIQSLSWDNILDLFQSARNKIVLIMPAIHQEWVEAIQSLHPYNNIELWICIDNQEKVYRSGYGDINSLKMLQTQNVTIKQCDNIRISFLGIDEKGWALFLESRIIAGNPAGPNAIALPTNEANQIIQSVFPELYSEVPADNILASATPLVMEQFEKVEQELIKNPPVEPDLQRQISTYNTLFQYAELHFDGGNLSAKTISIPKSALPFKDKDLKNRMNTRLNLFTKEDTEKWEELIEVKQKIDQIRKMLVSCSFRKDKSILKKEEKAAFEKTIEEAKTLATANMIKLKDKIQSAINAAEDTLRNELEIFFQSNPPESIKGHTDPTNIKRQIEKEINKILAQIKLPSANSLIEKIKIEAFYYELTWEDLHDEDFINWFKEKGLITGKEENELAKFSEAFQTKI